MPFLGFAGIFLGLFALVYALLSVTFLRVATSKRGGAKAKYREKTHKVSSAGAALLKRESLRFFKNPMIFLNCALGSLFLLMLPVFGLFKAEFAARSRRAWTGERWSCSFARSCAGLSR